MADCHPVSAASLFPFSSLPEELQGYIFETAVDSSTLSDAVKLLLVCRSAARWVQPRIYREVVLSPRHPDKKSEYMSLQTLRLRSDDFLALHMKRLCIPYTSIGLEDALKLLSTCPALVDLAIWVDFPAAATNPGQEAQALQQRLASEFCASLDALQSLCSLSFVDENLSRMTHAFASLPAWCSRLKYLDLIFWSEPKRKVLEVPLLEHMVSLTHLSLVPPSFRKEIQNEFDVRPILKARPTLEVILVTLNRVCDKLLEVVPADVRVIYRRQDKSQPIDYWKCAGRIGGSKWSTAEEEVARRKRGNL